MEENRRVKITKTMIKDAFLELLEKHPIEKISVTDICKGADVNRSTFYAYYTDVTELLHEIENNVLIQIPVSKELPEIYSDNNEYLKMLEDFFVYVKQNEKLFRTLIINSDSSDFNRRLVETIMTKYPKDTSGKNKILIDYGYIYSINGVIGLLRAWIMGGFPISAKVFAKIILEMSLRANDISGEDIGL